MSYGVTLFAGYFQLFQFDALPMQYLCNKSHREPEQQMERRHICSCHRIQVLIGLYEISVNKGG
jgi:hypothetical protein